MSVTHTLRVYVSPYCIGCAEAVALAETMALRFPSVRVEVIDVLQPEAALPAEVFATPTFVWNGKIYSLGNPARDRLAQMIAAELGQTG